ncbi:MAG: hypothetical protein LBC64_01505 [Fibromonadaceae bacterium]|jgi:hypothetical protein|nr:hypothetical protein [Fibromonadaceae bacterium]
MSKKLASLASILVASALIAGCSNTVKDNTLKVIQLTPSVQGVPMVAELNVADSKVMGQAKGKALFRTELEKEAVAEALRQVNGDVLVGANYFYEYSDANLQITVVGYPAHYKNFKPKELCETKENVLIGGNFSYEDGSNNNIQVTIKNPKPPITVPATPKPVVPPVSVAPVAPVTPAAQNTKSVPAASPKAVAPVPAAPIPAAPVAPIAPPAVPAAPAPAVPAAPPKAAVPVPAAPIPAAPAAPVAPAPQNVPAER